MLIAILVTNRFSHATCFFCRLQYRIQRFQRNQKWWWALWVWGIEDTMGNAYVLMKRFFELKGLDPKYDHHDFIEEVASALLDPDNYWPKRKSPDTAVPTSSRKRLKSNPSSSTIAVTPAARTAPLCPRVNDKSLSPNKGKLAHRLDLTLGHFPIFPRSGNGVDRWVCQLHRQADRKIHGTKRGIPSGARSNVMQCEFCGVRLCVKCWKIFHTCKNVEDEYENILCD